MRVLPAQLTLGTFKATFVWRTTIDASGAHTRAGAIPAAVMIDHGDHTALVAWARYEGLAESDPLFTLEALSPLTVDEVVECSVCPVRGRIVQGAWVPAEEG